MSQKISPLAGKPAPKSILIDIAKLLAAYADLKPDPAEASQRVAFGTSGHRGSSFTRSFNEWHILAISQAICEYRKSKGIDGPLFIGFDTHALSQPAFESALEVLAANGVETMISAKGEFTPTPTISHAILTYNKGRTKGLADGIVITPSHNPPDNGGFKYNPPNGGPADTDITNWVQDRANELIEGGLKEVKRVPFAQASKASTTHTHDYLDAYVADLGNMIDFDIIRSAGVHMGVDPLGGAGVHFWAPIAERYKLDLTVVSDTVDPQFAFMTVDWDGQIRMDPSSKYAMQRLIVLKDKYDVAFACDTDHDRHGIVTRSNGLMEPNHYLSVLIDYLFQNRPHWSDKAAIGKTVVSTAMVFRRPVRRLARFRRRRKRRRLAAAPRRFGVDHRQGRPGAGAAVGRDHRTSRQGPGRNLRTDDQGSRRTVRRPRRGRRHTGAEGQAGQAVAGSAAQRPAGRREDHPGARQGPWQRRRDRRHQGHRA